MNAPELRSLARRRAVGVLGGRLGNAATETLELARAIGSAAARRGWGIVSGGDGGVAESANLGCLENGGESIALLKWNRLQDASSNVTWAIPTSMDLARSNILNWAADGLLAFEGRYGTLGEIALALDTARPLIVLGSPHFLDTSALDVPSCLWVSNPRPSDASAILDQLDGLIGSLEAPPVRPKATLFSDPIADLDITLRQAVADDLPLFIRAFSDLEVQRWWQRDPSPANLISLVHERCLIVVAEGQPKGFIEYHADELPDFDHVGLDIVIADEVDRNRGVGARALHAFALAVFAAGHHRITVVPSPENLRARACYQKVGFAQVGVMRQYERHDGYWRDAVLLDLVAEDLR